MNDEQDARNTEQFNKLMQQLAADSAQLAEHVDTELARRILECLEGYSEAVAFATLARSLAMLVIFAFKEAPQRNRAGLSLVNMILREIEGLAAINADTLRNLAEQQQHTKQ